MSRKFSIILIAVILTLIAVNELFLKDNGAVSAQDKKTEAATIITPAATSTTTDSATATPAASSGEALIGGDFTLTDQNGNKFTQEDLKGKYSLVYFGFTHCPDVCPTALSNMSLALKQLGDDAKNFQIIFITADPERDDVKAMKDYIANFGPNIIGLTGSRAETDKAEQVYKVYAEKVTGEKDKGEYTMSHSSIIYIMDKDGKFITNLTHETSVADMVVKLKTLK